MEVERESVETNVPNTQKDRDEVVPTATAPTPSATPPPAQEAAPAPASDSAKTDSILPGDATAKVGFVDIAPSKLAWASLDFERTMDLIEYCRTALKKRCKADDSLVIASLKKVIDSSLLVKKYSILKDLLTPQRLVCSAEEGSPKLVFDLLDSKLRTLSEDIKSVDDGFKKSEGCDCFSCASSIGDLDAAVILSLLGLAGFADKASYPSIYEISKLILRECSTLGCISAKNELALIYLSSALVEEQDLAKEIIKDGVDARNGRSLMIMGLLYEQGRIPLDDSSKSKQEYALEFFRSAADAGDVRGMCRLSAHYEHLGDDAAAIKYLKQACDAGHARALSAMAERFLQGRGVKQNVGLALELLQTSATRGEIDAYKAVVDILGSQDLPIEALEWRLQGAFAGSAECQVDVAELLLLEITREGYTEEQKVKAVKNAFSWFLRASEQGHVKAQLTVASVYLNGELGLERNTEKCKFWASKAAEQDCAEALILLSHLRFSEGADQDYAEGVSLLKRAGDLGSARALFMLGRFHSLEDAHTIGLVHDIEISKKYLLEASLKGLPEAQALLAQQYLIQKEPDDKQAFYWFSRAAANDHSDSMFNLGQFYLRGRGVTPNIGAGYYWLKKAAAKGCKPAFRSLQMLLGQPEVRLVCEDHSRKLFSFCFSLLT